MKRTWMNDRAADFVVDNVCVNGKLLEKNKIFSYCVLEITLLNAWSLFLTTFIDFL